MWTLGGNGGWKRQRPGPGMPAGPLAGVADRPFPPPIPTQGPHRSHHTGSRDGWLAAQRGTLPGLRRCLRPSGRPDVDLGWLYMDPGWLSTSDPQGRVDLEWSDLVDLGWLYMDLGW